MSPAIPATSRVRNAAATRQVMLESAHQRFLHESYENVGLRDIAGDAGVDVALVSRYFGSKEELFRAVLNGGCEGAEKKFEPAVGEAGLPAYLAEIATHGKKEGEHLERLLIMLRSASSPAAGAVIREKVHAEMIEPIRSSLTGGDEDVRASLTLAILMGTMILRTVMSVEPLCECDRGDMSKRLQQLFETALARP